jgi:hypothetical protein
MSEIFSTSIPYLRAPEFSASCAKPSAAITVEIAFSRIADTQVPQL